MLCFSTPSTGDGKGLFIAPVVASVLRSCPLTAFVWFGCICQPHCATQTLARQRRTRFVPLCVVAFPATMLIPSLLTLRACTQRFPLKLPLLGGLSSQQDVPPKRDLSRSRIDLFPFPHHQTTPSFTSYLWPMALSCPILARYRLVAPGPCVCFPSKFVQESACCSCVCRNLEILHLRFLAFHAGFLLVFRSNQELGLV